MDGDTLREEKDRKRGKKMKEYTPRTVDILSFLYTIGYFVIMGVAFFQPFPEQNKDTLVILIGILSTVMVKIVESYFNKDSANSATATAVRAMTTPPNPLAVVNLIDKGTSTAEQQVKSDTR